MKRNSIRIIALVLLMCVCIVNVNVAQAAAKPYSVTIDGKAIGVSTVSKNGTIYFQLDKLMKAIGGSAKISKFPGTNSVYVDLKKGELNCYFSASDAQISVDRSNRKKDIYQSWNVKLDKKMYISKNILYVPLKFVTDVLKLKATITGYKVSLQTMKSQTLLVYMVASDLESNIGPGNPEGAATADLKEMMQVGSTDRVNVLVQSGGTIKWNNNIIKGTSVQRWYMQKGGMKNVGNLGQQNMGDPICLQKFIEWGISTYPADSYTLVLWNHGGGPMFGYGFDELSKDKLTLKELRTAFSNANKTTKKKFTTVVFDACIMNSLETAEMLTPYASNMVASSVPLPAHGLDYSVIVPFLEKDTDTEKSNFAYTLTSRFEDYAKKKGTIDDVELSCISLAKVKGFMAEFNKLMEKINKDVDANPQLIYDLAYARANDCNFKDEEIVGDGTDLIGLSMFLLQIGENFDNGKYKADTDKLRDMLDSEYSIHGKNSSFSGMIMYMPLTQFASSTFENSYLSLYKDIGFSKPYTDLVEKYSKKIISDDVKIDFIKNVTPGTFNYSYQASEPLNIKLSADSSKKIYKVSSVIEIYDDTTGKKFINGSYPTYYDKDDVDRGITENTHVFKMNGNYVSMLYNGEIDMNTKLFTVPVMYNDRQAVLSVIERSYNEFIIAGVKFIEENKTGMASKRKIVMKSTDIIEPMYIIKGQNGIELVRSNNKFSLENGRIESSDTSGLKAKYDLFYYIQMYNQKVIETDHVTLDVTNN